VTANPLLDAPGPSAGRRNSSHSQRLFDAVGNIPQAARAWRARGLLLAATLATAAACALALAFGRTPAAAAIATGRPNVIVIQTDDEDMREMYQTFTNPQGQHVPVMRKTLRLLGRAGVTFGNYYVSDSLCGPSRATYLTGEYAHNNGIEGNNNETTSGGGYPNFIRSAAAHHNLAVWLQRAGYRTIHIGKFLNRYGEPPYTTPTEEPPGWSDWQSLIGESSNHHFYGYELNENGTVQGPFGNIGYEPKDAVSCPFYAPPESGGCNYQTDVLTQRTEEQINASTQIGKPFYLALDYVAPHGDEHPPAGPEPAPRYYGSLATLHLPRPPNFNEADVFDKPSFIRDLPPLTPGEIHSITVEYQNELEALRSVDDGVERIVDTLRQDGQLNNTYIFFTSDNGYFEGEHRIKRSKFLPYESSTHLPMLLRGPGLPHGVTSNALVSNVDLAPTILKIAGARADSPLDGISMLRFAEHPLMRSQRAVLLESFFGNSTDAAEAKAESVRNNSAPPISYVGIRLGPYKYVEYVDGEKELYNLQSDPYELTSEVRNPEFFPIRNYLARQLQWLEHCSGPRCRLPLGRDLPLPRGSCHPKKKSACLHPAEPITSTEGEGEGPTPPGSLYSYWRASSTSSRAARRAGPIAARTPASAAKTRSKIKVPTG
jgi:N-acetylglucosamine-6-sulfatase